MLSKVSKFYINIISSVAGLDKCRQNGVKLGRPTTMNDGLRSAIQLLRSNRMGIKQIAREVGVGIGTVYLVI